MPELDFLKEKISYLRLWLGLLAVTDLILIGWLAANFSTTQILFIVSDCVAIGMISALILVLDKKIRQQIEGLGEL